MPFPGGRHRPAGRFTVTPAAPAAERGLWRHAVPDLPLSPAARTEALRRLGEEELDVLVVGGWAAGTSSRSSKLFHGGLRYLEQLNFALVFEALKERRLALEKLGPHLAHPVEFLCRLQKAGIDRGYAGLGIGVYDVMGAGRGVPSHLRHHGKRSTYEAFPSASPAH